MKQLRVLKFSEIIEFYFFLGRYFHKKRKKTEAAIFCWNNSVRVHSMTSRGTNFVRWEHRPHTNFLIWSPSIAIARKNDA